MFVCLDGQPLGAPSCRRYLRVSQPSLANRVLQHRNVGGGGKQGSPSPRSHDKAKATHVWPHPPGTQIWGLGFPVDWRFGLNLLMIW